ncbi:MAG TPA: hypothetical protein VFM49_02400 [Chloroflexia bacterium]|nr:hypothetical protein [Chloroflexia bacterium]
MLRPAMRILAVGCGLLLTIGGVTAVQTQAAGSTPTTPAAVNTPAPAPPKVTDPPITVDPGFAATVQGYPDPGFSATVKGYPDPGFTGRLTPAR